MKDFVLEQMPTPEEDRSPSTWLSRAAAVFEVVGVLITGIVLTRVVQSALGIESWKAVQAAMLESGDADFWKLARLATVEQVLKYGFVFLLFYGIGRWQRGRRLPYYGFRLRGASLGSLVIMGVVGWAAAGVLPHTLQFLASHYPLLGQGPDHWSLFPSTWSLGFIVYMAASSFLLVPFVEELFARGYMVTRFGEDYGRAGGVLLSAAFFALAHGQYFKAEVLSLGMLVSLVIGSLIMGYMFVRTGSLVPVIVAHALVNIPIPPVDWARIAVLALMALVLTLSRGPVMEWLRDGLAFLEKARWRWTGFGAFVLALCLAAVASSASLLPYVAFGFLGAGVLVQIYERPRVVA